ncbi:MAG: BACON domain-containing carbohydrate-binding protein [Coriobacteriia bacterium]
MRTKSHRLFACLIAAVTVVALMPAGAFAARIQSTTDYPAPTVTTSPTTLDFGSVDQGTAPGVVTRTLTVSVGTIAGLPPEAANLAATWSVTHNLSWLTISPSSGSAGLGQSFSISVSVDTRAATPGDYSGQINVNVVPPTPPTGAASLRSAGLVSSLATVTQAVPVMMRVVEETPAVEATTPVIEVAPIAVSLTTTQGTNPAPFSIAISNAGTGTLSWEASEAASWLSIAPASGTDSSTLVGSVNTTGLAVGRYDATITVTAAGASNSPVTIPVHLVIAQRVKPRWTVSTPSCASVWRLGVRNLVVGSISPWRSSFAGGVRLQFQIYSRGAWRAATLLPATVRIVGNGRRYQAYFRPTYAGTYRVRATYAENATYAGANSAWRTFIVRR